MPRISGFYGITIRMYYDEVQHGGRPHFHARYGDAEAVVDIQHLEIIAGALLAQAWRLVTEWVSAHQFELRRNWNRAREHQPLSSIEPLK